MEVWSMKKLRCKYCDWLGKSYVSLQIHLTIKHNMGQVVKQRQERDHIYGKLSTIQEKIRYVKKIPSNQRSDTDKNDLNALKFEKKTLQESLIKIKSNT